MVIALGVREVDFEPNIHIIIGEKNIHMVLQFLLHKIM